MPILVGIDEAGYGPPLGPLVVSAAAFRVRDPGVDLWQALAAVVRRCGTGRKGDSLVVDDSKRVYSSGRGLKQLERTVLSFTPPTTPLPCQLADWLPAVGYTRLAGLASMAWYVDSELELPTAATVDDASEAASRLAECQASAGVELVGVRVLPCFPPELNELFQRLDNKSVALFVVTGRLLRLVWQRADDEPVWVVLDKHGGRQRYYSLLRRAFPDEAVVPVTESSERSHYRVRSGPKRMEVIFEQSADSRHMPAALASMYSKYVRELFMLLENRFWATQVPGLKPTAGYPQDARRFLADIHDCRQGLNIPDHLLVRSR